MEEKRRHPRVATSLEVVYYTGAGETPPQERIHYFGTITDVSRGGARLIADQPHSPQDRIWLQGVRAAADVVPGQVRWVRGEDERYHLGVEFLNVV